MKLEIISKKPEHESKSTPLLFVHGMWHGAWCWEENFLPYFAQKGFISYALSLRGHGKSEGRKGLRWTSLNDYVSDVSEAIKEINRTPILIGHSMGGMVIPKYLEANPKEGAVLMASAPPTGVMAYLMRAALKFPLSYLKSNLTLSLQPFISSMDRCRFLFFSDDLPQEKLQKYFNTLIPYPGYQINRFKL